MAADAAVTEPLARGVEDGTGRRNAPPLMGSGVRAALATAVCALLSPAAQAEPPKTEVQSAALVYTEPGRVTAVETVARASRELGGERFVRFRLVFDSLTGASANGAIPSARVQTFTRPSGKGSYQVQPGKTPLDDTFHDTRVAANLDYDWPAGRLARVDLGGSISNEYDYRSIGLSATASRDFNLRNTTVTAGVSGSFDTVNPVGGVPESFAAMRPAGQAPARSGDTRNKRVLDLLAGVTQVVNRSTIVQANYSFSRSSGYLTDPYKLLAVVGAPSGPRAGEPVGLADGGYLYERRPGTRTKHGLYGEARHTPGSDVLAVSYRYLWDDWGLRSHTIEGRYRWFAGEHAFFEPHLRYYLQSAASFHRHSLIEGEALPEHASADYRLGEMDAVTGGLKYGRTIRPNQEAAIRIEYYSQQGDGTPADAIGAERLWDLFPRVDSWIGQISYNISF